MEHNEYIGRADNNGNYTKLYIFYLYEYFITKLCQFGNLQVKGCKSHLLSFKPENFRHYIDSMLEGYTTEAIKNSIAKYNIVLDTVRYQKMVMIFI